MPQLTGVFLPFQQLQRHRLSMKICNICGNDSFGGGPGGRMSLKGFPPRCEKCQSLERHRIYRKVFEALASDEFKNLSFLQFSKDQTVDPKWFSSHEISIYGGDNSLDLQDIDKDSGAYDIVMCNHVLEHVADDKSALRELFRIIKEDGFIFLTVPNPLNKAKTTDWGFPREDQHGHYRIYGADFQEKLIDTLPSAWILSKIEADDATGSEDIVFFICQTEQRAENISSKLTNSKKVHPS